MEMGNGIDGMIVKLFYHPHVKEHTAYGVFFYIAIRKNKLNTIENALNPMAVKANVFAP
jgi:hypothetical protein